MYGEVPTKNVEIENKIIEISKEETISIDHESITTLLAYIQYVIISNDDESIDILKKICEKMTSYSNERYILFDMDAVFEDYVWIIKLIESKTNIDNSKDLFHSMDSKKIDANKAVIYQISSPYNLYCFVVALAYQDKDISNNLARNLKIIFHQLEKSVSSDNYRDAYYMRQIADLLNIEYHISPKPEEEIENSYYSLLLYEKTVEIENFDSTDNSTLEFLASANVCKKMMK